MTSPTLEARIAGAAWGHLVGDAMGVPYEFSRPGTISTVEWGHQGMHGKPPGTWSDDGALMLALLDSLLDRGFDVEDQAHRALRWMTDGAYTPDGDVFDIGIATRAALSRVRSGTPATEAGGTGEGDNGNGSLMRILPIALVARDEEDDVLVAQASAASAVTHAHPRSRVTCALYILLARTLLRGEPDRDAALRTARSSLEAVLPAEWRADYELLAHFEGRTGSGYVVDCFWSAWQAFSSAASYAETIEDAVRFGRDTDTTACVAGGLAGIYWGIDAIPADWRRELRGQEIVHPLVARLVAAAG
ncbi:MAG: ADP-ribosylglycohydrolase family protein [Candidatus Dormibacteria bacterium]